MLLQEGLVNWNPTRQSGWLAASILFWIGVIYGYWRLLHWYVGRRMDRIGWRGTRYVLPSILLPAGLLAVWIADLAFGEDQAFEVVVGICIFLNAPGLIGAGVAAFALVNTSLPDWALASVAAVLSWVSWYLVILLVEFRIESATPVRLDLSGH
jgi:hypothetical protein